jgi:hypothetical protein
MKKIRKARRSSLAPMEQQMLGAASPEKIGMTGRAHASRQWLEPLLPSAEGSCSGVWAARTTQLRRLSREATSDGRMRLKRPLPSGSEVYLVRMGSSCAWRVVTWPQKHNRANGHG